MFDQALDRVIGIVDGCLGDNFVVYVHDDIEAVVISAKHTEGQHVSTDSLDAIMDYYWSVIGEDCKSVFLACV